MSYKVGDTAYFVGGSYGRNWARRGTVAHVTPTGCVRVNYTLPSGKPSSKTFLANGRERGGDRFHAPHLCDEATYNRIKVEERGANAARNAAIALKKASEIVVRAENKAKLVEALKAALAAAEAI